MLVSVQALQTLVSSYDKHAASSSADRSRFLYMQQGKICPRGARRILQAMSGQQNASDSSFTTWLVLVRTSL
jgi:hypothetical protein